MAIESAFSFVIQLSRLKQKWSEKKNFSIGFSYILEANKSIHSASS